MTSPALLQVTGAIEAARGFDDVLQVAWRPDSWGWCETQILEEMRPASMSTRMGLALGTFGFVGLAVFRQVVQVVEIEIAGEGSVKRGSSSLVRTAVPSKCRRDLVYPLNVRSWKVTALVSSPVRRRR